MGRHWSMGSHSIICPRQRWPPCLHPNRAGWYLIYRPCKDERLSWPSWLHTEMVYPSTDGTQPGTNQVWHSATTLIEANALPLSHTTVTSLQKKMENVCSHKSLRFSTTRKIHTVNGAQTLMYLQYHTNHFFIIQITCQQLNWHNFFGSPCSILALQTRHNSDRVDLAGGTKHR